MEKKLKETNHKRMKKDNKYIYCVNCGERGHIVKECKAPITSFGIIAFKVNFSSNDEKYDKNEKINNILKSEFIFDKDEKYPKIKFLMIQRKDTIGYIDFIRGKYHNVHTCINEMTRNEKLNILTKTFDELWDELWVCNGSRENFYKQEYTQAKMKFNKLDINTLIKNIDNSKYSHTEFGFPKGKRELGEMVIDCAEREFLEETRYNKNTYQFIKNYPTIEEKFTGTNGIEYRHIYYLVKMKDNIQPVYIDTNNRKQYGEVQNIGWFSFDECVKLIRPYDKAKKDILSKVYNDLLIMNNNYECSEFYYRTI
jgi:8-oxo-dGTP pyrophosphatase MutT (NUDIX family)